MRFLLAFCALSTFSILSCQEPVVDNNDTTTTSTTETTTTTTTSSSTSTTTTTTTTMEVDPCPAGETTIAAIQGSGHVSPLVDCDVVVEGIVTDFSLEFFWMQSATDDGDPTTSEGIRVAYNRPDAEVELLDTVFVVGTVVEARESDLTLSLTQIDSSDVFVVGAATDLPDPIVLGAGGRQLQATAIHTSGTEANVEDLPFDTTANSLDFYETLEGMRVQVNDGLVVGPAKSWGDVVVLPDAGVGANVTTTPRGGIIIAEDYSDFNPERIFLSFGQGNAPTASVGDQFNGAVVGILSYNLGFPNYNVLVTETAPPVIDNMLVSESTALVGSPTEISVATVNVLNLGGSAAQQRFDDLADQIVNDLNVPDIVAFQEIQDNDAGMDSGDPAADQTMQTIVDAINTLIGFATYDWTQIDPLDKTDGGAPGSNIRVAFIYNTARLQLGTAAIGVGDAETDIVVSDAGGGVPQFSHNPGRIKPLDIAWEDSRKPLAAHFIFTPPTPAVDVYVVNAHFNSKRGDTSLAGRVQPPRLDSEPPRNAKARLVRDFISEIQAIDADANVIMLGDLNDFHFSPPMDILTETPTVGSPMINLISAQLPVNERYTYIFEGNSQTLDHILVSTNLSASSVVDVVHMNTEFSTDLQISDHDPVIATVDLS